MLLYDSLTRSKKPLKPLNSPQVLMYVCGITPYDTTHLGHAFVYVTTDVLFRYLQHKNYQVNYVQNVTDIDDDILRKAKEEGRDWKELGEFWTSKFLADLKSLNILPSTHYVKVTDSIERIVAITKNLIEKGYAYEASGTVFYDTSKFKKYGELSKFNKEQMELILSERGGDPLDPRKKNPLDFILWQKGTDGEPKWRSPWSDGRPGWHIECTSVIDEFLGSQIDIHGGGRDLIFPHHESEIAQSEVYTGKSPFVGHWMHEAMVMYQGEKMSKSLGNLILVSELLKKYSENEIRWLLLSHHYRDVWEYKEEEFEQIKKNVKLIESVCSNDVEDRDVNEFEQLLDDDLDTRGALNLLVDMAKSADVKEDEVLKQTVSSAAKLLGFKV